MRAISRLLPLALLLVAAPLRAGDEARPEVLGRDGAGTLYRFGDQRVLVVRGEPRAMGLAHGRLLRDGVRANVRAFLDEWAIGRMGRTREELKAIWARLAPHVPPHYREELEGLAEGAGVPLEDVQLVHALPSRYHCTGTAVTPDVSRDGKVHHTRSLDYALDIGDEVRPQSHALLLVAVPDDGHAHAVVSWAGFVGCVTGMSLAGVSVGEMGSRSSDETFDGVPMVFGLREVLRRADDLAGAKTLWTAMSRTCGYNFLFCDRDEVCAVESTRGRVRFFGPGDEAENVAPHAALAGIVRRCNHFVDPELAKTQRDPYDPRKSSGSSWMAYEHQGRFLDERRGEVGPETMVALLRTYPPSHPCLHQAVMCPTDGTILVAHATDPAEDPLPGAQNQPFYAYDLKALVAGEPVPARVHGARRELADGAERGRVDGERAIEGFFAHAPQTFAYAMEPLRELGGTRIYKVTFPSPGPSLFEENLTVHAEYYRPAGEGPFPTAIVLHILDGRFYVARLLATMLARRGVAALFIKLPYYGERRPERLTPEDLARIDLPGVVSAVRQAVRDVRRGAAWLRARDEVDPGKIGVVGVSLGSFVAQLAAGADGGFDRCAFVLGGGSIERTLFNGSRETKRIVATLEGRGWTRPRVAEALAPVEPSAHVAGIEKDSVLMINCRADEIVPPETTRAYWKALGEPEIVWYDGGHYALKDHVFEVVARITSHFVR